MDAQNKMIEIPVIQMWQPWASWVVEGWKTIETRTHNKFVWMLNREVVIHACMKWDNNAIELARPYLTEEQIATTEYFKNIRGCIIGSAFVSQVNKLSHIDSKFALIDCHNTVRYGLFLTDVKKIHPIKFRGAQRQLYISKKVDI